MQNSTPYIDFHCHSYCENSTDIIEIVSVDPLKNKADHFHTFGYHPWWHDTFLEESELSLLKNYIIDKQNCLAIGECGLDKFIQTNDETQIHNFVEQIKIANLLNLPIIIHCVRKYEELIKIYKKYAKTEWVIHGFKRNKSVAKTLMDLGIRFSVAPHDEMTTTFIESLKYIPIESIHLETDSDRRTPIFKRYELYAELKNIPLVSVQEKLFENTKNLFRRF